MLRTLIVYGTKYGNTKLVAENIQAGMETAGDIDVVCRHVAQVETKTLPDYDVLVIGSPNHVGMPTRKIKKFIDSLGKHSMKGKKFAAFDTYMSKDFEKVVKKMEKRINKKVPDLERLAPGLSIKVKGMKGPLAEGELPRCKEFGSKIATLVMSSSEQ